MSGYTYVGKLNNSFICDKRLKDYDVRVFLVLLKWDSFNKPKSIEFLAEEIGLSTKSFGRSLKRLEMLKYIKIERKTNWETNKYKILNKAHGTDVPNDETVSPPDRTESPVNEGTESPMYNIPNNIPIKETIKKKAPAAEKDKELITEVIKLWNTISGQTLSVTTKQYRDSIRWCIGQLNRTDDKLSKFRYAFENKKRMYDDPDHILSQFNLPMVLRQSKFMGNVDAEKYGIKKVDIRTTMQIKQDMEDAKNAKQARP